MEAQVAILQTFFGHARSTEAGCRAHGPNVSIDPADAARHSGRVYSLLHTSQSCEMIKRDNF